MAARITHPKVIVAIQYRFHTKRPRYSSSDLCWYRYCVTDFKMSTMNLLAIITLAICSLATFTFGKVKVETYDLGERIHSMDGKVSNDHILFETYVASRLACAKTCMKYGRCSAFSTSPDEAQSKKQLACRGHESKLTLHRHTVHVTGSKTYVFKNRPPASRWLRRQCSQDSGCPTDVADVKCFEDAGQCLCTIGFYYSHWLDGCVRTCSRADLQPLFVRYPEICINYMNIGGQHTVSSLHECHARCLANSKCCTFEVQGSYACYLQEVTFLDPLEQGTLEGNCDHFQLTCL